MEIMNLNDKKIMKMAMLKHEETFREQVYELHRLYQIQKTLMKDIPKATSNNYDCDQPEARRCLDLDRPAEEFNIRDSESGNDHHTDLELTLGLSSYYHRKIKADEPGSDSGPGFSSSSNGSSNVKRTRREEIFRGFEKMPPLSNQDRVINNPPWLFQALSLNMT
ncbi:hypothetical protein ACJIZ3_014933 [Penstemon smallii]|uniref:Uncharacterized protein n=1 Tax=Penstemon smallii TaxID=265156 RepID=A0ABD3RL09_9LAMI